MIDIVTNKRRAETKLTIPFIEKSIQTIRGATSQPLAMPIYWILLLGAVVQFVSVLLITISVCFLYKKYQAIKLSYNNRILLNRYKIIFVIITVLVFLLTYMYSMDMKFTDGNTRDDIIKLFLFFCIIGIFILEKVNLFFANSFSSIIRSSVDG
jgi:hypothetical protein